MCISCPELGRATVDLFARNTRLSLSPDLVHNWLAGDLTVFHVIQGIEDIQSALVVGNHQYRRAVLACHLA